MPRTNVPVVTPNRTPGLLAGGTGVSEVDGDTTNDNSFTNGDGTYCQVRNAHATVTYTVTFPIAQVVDGITPVAVAQNVVALTTRLFGPFPANVYTQADGTVWVNIDDASGTNLKLKAVQVPR